MLEELKVEGKVENNVIILSVEFNQEFLMSRQAGEQLSSELTRRYREIRQERTWGVKTSFCIVEIKSQVAGSSLVRALFELWREVVGREGGQVICVNYPAEYIDSLTSLGLPALEGFTLAETIGDAMARINKM